MVKEKAEKKSSVKVQEKVEDNVTREEPKENPMEQVELTEKVRVEGNWKKASPAEVAKYEADGVLLGFDPNTKEVLIKE